MSSDISWGRTMLPSIWVESILYGIFLLLYCACIYLYGYRRRTWKINKHLIFTTTAMFILATLHVSLAFAQILITPDLLTSGAAMALIEAGSDIITQEYIKWDLLNPAVDAVYVTNQVLADGLLIYRCFVVWNRNLWIICLPVLMLLATTICGYIDVHVLVQCYTTRRDWNDSPIGEWPTPRFIELSDLDINLTTALLSASLATSVIVTALIAWRIWWHMREMDLVLGRRGKTYRSIIALIVESGVIYSAGLLIWLITNALTDYASQIPWYAMTQVMNIVPTVIVLRVALRNGPDYSTYTTTLTNTDRRQTPSLHFAPISPDGSSNAKPWQVDAWDSEGGAELDFVRPSGRCKSVQVKSAMPSITEVEGQAEP